MLSHRSAADGLGLDPDGALDQLAKCGVAGRTRRSGVRLDQVEDRGIGDETALDDLGQAAHDLGNGQGREVGEVADHAEGLVEGSDQVLARVDVDTGLSANSSVDHAQQGRGQVDDRDATQPGRRHEPGEVGGRAARPRRRQRRYG
jgi:hypothetical protein